MTQNDSISTRSSGQGVVTAVRLEALAAVARGQVLNPQREACVSATLFGVPSAAITDERLEALLGAEVRVARAAMRDAVAAYDQAVTRAVAAAANKTHAAGA